MIQLSAIALSLLLTAPNDDDFTDPSTGNDFIGPPEAADARIYYYLNTNGVGHAWLGFYLDGAEAAYGFYPSADGQPFTGEGRMKEDNDRLNASEDGTAEATTPGGSDGSGSVSGDQPSRMWNYRFCYSVHWTDVLGALGLARDIGENPPPYSVIPLAGGENCCTMANKILRAIDEQPPVPGEWVPKQVADEAAKLVAEGAAANPGGPFEGPGGSVVEFNPETFGPPPPPAGQDGGAEQLVVGPGLLIEANSWDDSDADDYHAGSGGVYGLLEAGFEQPLWLSDWLGLPYEEHILEDITVGLNDTLALVANLPVRQRGVTAVDWGDGSGDAFEYLGESFEFELSQGGMYEHQYTSEGTFPLRLQAIKDGAIVLYQMNILVTGPGADEEVRKTINIQEHTIPIGAPYNLPEPVEGYYSVDELIAHIEGSWGIVVTDYLPGQ